MSAFIVRNETVNGLIAYIRWDDMSSRSYHRTRYTLQEYGFKTDEASLRGLAHEMMRLNIYGVDARYGEGQGMEMGGDCYQYNEAEPNPGHLQALTNLQCLIYQCSEGDVTERPLYKMLLELERVIATDIVRIFVPKAEATVWG